MTYKIPEVDIDWDTYCFRTYEQPSQPNSVHCKVFVDPHIFLRTVSYQNRNHYWPNDQTLAVSNRHLFCLCIPHHIPILCHKSKSGPNGDRNRVQIGLRLWDIVLKNWPENQKSNKIRLNPPADILVYIRNMKEVRQLSIHYRANLDNFT